MAAASPQIAHQARLVQQKMTRKQSHPQGNYDHSQFQWGVIDAIHLGPPPSVDVYLDGTQNTGNPAYLTLKIPYAASYTPTVKDTVLVRRGMGRSSSDRTVICKLAGATSPYPLPLGYLNSSNQYIQGPNAMWGGPGVPADSLGMVGDAYWRTDGAVGSTLYKKTASTTWSAIL